MAGRILRMCVQARRKHPDKAEVRKIGKMRHHFGSKPKQFCENRPGPYQDTLHLLSAGRGGRTGEWRAGAALMKR